MQGDEKLTKECRVPGKTSQVASRKTVFPERKKLLPPPIYIIYFRTFARRLEILAQLV